MGGPLTKPLEDSIKRLENETIVKSNATKFEKQLRKDCQYRNWSEVQVCKKRTGISKQQFPQFLEDFKRNNDLTEGHISPLRDLQTCASLADKIKTFYNEEIGGFVYGMIAAETRYNSTIDFIVSLYVLKYNSGNNLQTIEMSEFREDYIKMKALESIKAHGYCLLYTSPSPRDGLLSRMPSSA